MDRFKELWETASPGHKRLVVILCVVVALFILVSIFDGDGPSKKTDKVQEGVVTDNLFMDGDPRSLGMDALNAKMKKLEEQEAKRNAEIEHLQKQLKQFKDQQIADQERRIGQMEQRFNGEIQDRFSETETMIEDLKKRPSAPDEAGLNTAPRQTVSPEEVERRERRAREAFAEQAKKELDPFDPGASSVSIGNSAVDENGKKTPPPIRVIGQASDKTAERKKLESPLPSGSILTGVLLHGVDAPATGRGGGKGENHPVLVRIKKEAILPNRYRTDIRDCHVVMSGYGDLSSERGYFRSERFSCVTVEGEIVDIDLKGYAVGEDGKLGLRGPVTSKQGAIVARTMWAEFLKGWGNALGATATGSQIQFDTDDQNLDVLSSQVQKDAVQQGLGNGFSESMDRLAEFYIQMAESMVPVVEIDGGRKISIVITNGTSFQPLAGQAAQQAGSQK